MGHHDCLATVDVAVAHAEAFAPSLLLTLSDTGDQVRSACACLKILARSRLGSCLVKGQPYVHRVKYSRRQLYLLSAVSLPVSRRVREGAP